VAGKKGGNLQPSGTSGNLQGGEIKSFDILDNSSIAWDLDAFDEALRAHGLTFMHYRGMPNPVGLVDKFDSRRPEDDNSDSSNGLLYTCAGAITGCFTGNSKSKKSAEDGQMNDASAQITFPRHYDGTQEPIYLNPMDRLFLKEESVCVTHQQLVNANQTGEDRLQFPAIKVLDLVDSRGNRYNEAADFDVRNGVVHWCGTRRPMVDPTTGKGSVYGIRFTYRPYWYVDSMQHEIRMAQWEDPFTGERKTVRMPQAIRVLREYVFLNTQNDEKRSAPQPAEDGFGPR